MRNRFSHIQSLAFATAMVLALPTQAHHAFSAEFDAEKPINIEGTVTKLELVNPHSWLYLDVKQADGSVANWGLEFGAPFSLKEKGVTKATLPVGSQVRIEGYRAKNGKNFGYAVTTFLADGRSVKTGGAQDAPGAQTNQNYGQ